MRSSMETPSSCFRRTFLLAVLFRFCGFLLFFFRFFGVQLTDLREGIAKHLEILEQTMFKMFPFIRKFQRFFRTDIQLAELLFDQLEFLSGLEQNGTHEQHDE